MFDLLFSIIAIGAVSFLPLAIIVATVAQKIETRRVARLAATSVCFGCGRVLGLPALKRSDDAWTVYVKNKSEDTRALWRLRMVRPHHAICTACGRAHRYLAKEQTFVEIQGT